MAAGVPAGTLSIEIIAEIARLQDDMRKAEKAVGDMARVVGGSAAAAGNSLTKLGQTAGASAQQFTRSMNQVQQVSGNARAGMQQLSYQISDVATSFAGGISPMMIFAQQGSQVVQSIALMRGSATGLVGFLAGPWGAALMGAVSVLGMLIPKLLETSDGMDKVKFASSAVGDAQSILGGVMDVTTGKINNQSGALMALARAQIAVARIQAQSRQAEARSSISSFQERDLQLQGGMGGGLWLKDRNPGAVKAISGQVLSGQLKSDEAIKRLTSLQRAGALTEEQFIKAAQAVANFAVEGENMKVFDSAQRMLDGVGTALDRNLILKPAKVKKAAKEANDALKELLKTAEWLADTKMEAHGNVWQLAQDMGKRQQDWGKDLKTWGEENIEAMEAADRVREGQLDTEYRLLDVYLQQVDAIRQMGGAFDTIGGLLQGLSTGNFMSVGGKIGGFLSTIGNVNTGVMAESKYGAAGNLLDKPEKLGETIADHLEGVFRENGPFFQAFKGLLANAALGSTAASLTGGSKLGGALGGAIGGKLGKDLLAKPLTDALGKTLGSFAGPLGSALGGVVGGLVGGLFKKTKYGTAGISMNQFGELEANVLSGRGSAQKGAAKGAAGHVINGIQDIAEALGAKITGVPNITIGTYKDKYRVSTTGYQGKLNFNGKSAEGLYDFGKDGAEDAIAFAIQKAIEGGVITGISQASINILKSGQDLQKAIEKATLIESIPKELQKLTDPVGYAVNEVNDKFKKIVDALREGGATAEQMAQAQQLYNLEMAQAKEDANSAASALKDFIKSMNMGSASPLSLRDQAMNAKSALDPFLTQINAGQAINQDKYLDAAQTYLDIERQMYGSTAKYFEAFDQIQAATNKAIAATENVAPIRTTADPFIEQTADATKSVAASTANMEMQMETMNGFLKTILEKMVANQNVFIGSLRNYS